MARSEGDATKADGTDHPQGDGPTTAQLADDQQSFVSLTGHFYRGEVDRTTAWRTRLDQTTNWAVILMAAILTFSFSSTDNPHYVLLIGFLGVGAFLVVESQRYQEYDAWRNRVRILQRYLLAGVLAPADAESGDWRSSLGADLREPEVTYPRWRAMGHRLKRVYFFLLTVLIASWTVRITVFAADESWRQTAAVGGIPGPVVVLAVGICYLAAAVLTGLSILEGRKREFGTELPERGE